MWSIYTGAYYLAIERIKLLIHGTTCENLKNNMLGEEARYKKLHIVWFHLHHISRKITSIWVESKSVVPWGWEWASIVNNGGRVAMKYSKTALWCRLHNSINSLNITVLSICKGWILWYVSSTSLKMLKQGLSSQQHRF